jgi:hypothetical protein
LRFQQAADGILAKGQAALERDWLAVVLHQARLGIEGVDAGGSTVHEQENDTLGLGREVGNLRREEIDGGRLGGHEGAEAQEAESGGGLLEEGSSGEECHGRGHVGILALMVGRAEREFGRAVRAQKCRNVMKSDETVAWENAKQSPKC